MTRARWTYLCATCGTPLWPIAGVFVHLDTMAGRDHSPNLEPQENR